MKTFFHILITMASIAVTMLAITACGPESTSNNNWDKPGDHTLLMYLEGDNSLSNALELNIRMAQRAMLDSVKNGKLNLVVMKDNQKPGDNKPILYWVRRNEQMMLDTVVIKKWSQDVDMTSPEIISEVLHLTFSRFNTRIKGLVLGSHALGWVPHGNFNDYSDVKRTSPRAFGYDESVLPFGSIELWDMGDVLQQGPKLDYILMDCCHMGNAEVAYELRNVADYMVACPTEEEGDGLPYLKLVPALARCQSADDLPATLTYCAKCYYDLYARSSYGASISVFSLRQAEALANAYKQVLANSTSILSPLATASGAEVTAATSHLIHYGRENNSLHNRYYFYDMANVIDWLDQGKNSAEARQAHQAIDQLVLWEGHTDAYRQLNIKECCGLGVTLPEILHLASSSYMFHFSPFSAEKLLTGYHLTAWGREMGY